MHHHFHPCQLLAGFTDLRRLEIADAEFLGENARNFGVKEIGYMSDQFAYTETLQNSGGEIAIGFNE